VTFEQYVERRLPELLRIAAAIAGERQLGEDLVQDVLVKLHGRWASVQGMDNSDAYVRRMLVNEFLSWRRKWSRLVPHADAGRYLADASGDHAQAHADRDALLREIARLPERQRVVITLRYLADLSDADIAESLGCKESTVRVHASRALTALRVSSHSVTKTEPVGGRRASHRG
jgi:RNA polymerase sigma-70 factor (sigma-E family)